MAAPKFIPAATSLDPNAGLDTSNFKRQMALAALLSQGAGDKISSVPEGVGHVISKGLGGWMAGAAEADKKASESKTNALRAQTYAEILGGSDSIPTRGVGGIGSDRVAGGDYESIVASKESGNNPLAKNPNSSATGTFQFTSGTWGDLMRNRPELGLTPDGRTDVEQQKRAMAAFTADNKAALEGAGIEPTPGNLYTAHFLGAGGATQFLRGMQQDPSVPATALVSPAAARANRTVFFHGDGRPKTAGEVYGFLTRRFSGNVITPPNVGNNMAVTPSAPTAPMPNMADMPAPGAAPTAMAGQGFAVPSGSPVAPNFDQTFARDETMQRLMQRRSPDLASGLQSMAQGMNAQPAPMADPDIPPPEMPGPLPPELMPPPAPQMASAPMPPPRPADLPVQGGQQTSGPQPPMPPPGYTPGMLAPIQERANPAPYLAPFQTPQAPTPQMLAQGLVQGGPEGQMSIGQQAQAPQQDRRRQLVAQLLADPNVSPAEKSMVIQLLQSQTQPQPADFGVIGENADGSKQYGFIDKRTRTATPYGSPGSGQPRFRTLTDPAERAKFGIAPNDNRPYQVGADGKLVSPSGQSINMPGASEGKVFDEIKESATTARSAATGLQSLREARQAVEGGAILGAGADLRLGLQKIGAALGVADAGKIVNTETFRSAIAPQVAALMKATVGSTQISNADRDFAEKAAGGSINLDPGTITRLLGIMEKAGIAAIEGHRKRLEKVYPDANSRERVLFDVPMPTAPQTPAASGAAPGASPPPGNYRWNPQTNQMEPDR